jgi:predicted porin
LEKLEMKKTLVALAALASVSAFAQSSVTISGVADVGLVYNNSNTDNQGSEKLVLGSGNNNRIIFSGVEDLGGGLAATFAFQLRLDPTTGNNERGTAVTGNNGAAGVGIPAATPTSRPLFQGESTVGLRGGFGSIKLGRWLTAVQLPNGGMIDPWGVTTVAGNVYASGFASDYVQGGEGRVGNAIFYSSPSFGGFSGNVSLGFLKGPTGQRHTAIAGIYSNGPINAMLGWERNRVNDTLVQLGANYDLGVVKLYAGYGNIKGGNAADRVNMTYLSTASGTQVATGGNIKDYTIGVSAPFGAATVRAGYSRWNFNGAPGAQNESKIGLGLNYALSKRTAVYTDLANQTRNNAALSRVSSFDVGIAHSF